jgi:ribosomal protein S18 acetylase RimI-like enzyme
MKNISPVPWRKQFQALRHLVYGTDEDFGFDAHVESLRRLFKVTPRKRKWLWWHRSQDGEIQGVVMVLVSKGSVPFLYHSPVGGHQVNFESLVDLIRKVSLEVLNRGYCIIQRFVSERQHPDVSALLAAGFEELVKLVYMVAPLGKQSSAGVERKEYGFVNCKDSQNGELETAIQRSYHGSLDCPRLVGVRPISDIINSHKTTGEFTPQWWWILRSQGSPVGCILVNRTVNKDEAEIVYLGVVPEYRGKALGELMLKHISTCARCDGIKQLTLAVDSRNSVAIDLYERFGFRKKFSRLAYTMFGEAINR